VDDVMKLFKNIVSLKICNNDTFKDGFEGTMEFLMDIGVDKPLAYSFTGQLLFSAGLDFQDITKLLKHLDDDKLIGRIIKGYANALRNDVVN
jgi:translation initiation factor 4G